MDTGQEGKHGKIQNSVLTAKATNLPIFLSQSIQANHIYPITFEKSTSTWNFLLFSLLTQMNPSQHTVSCTIPWPTFNFSSSIHYCLISSSQYLCLLSTALKFTNIAKGVPSSSLTDFLSLRKMLYESSFVLGYLSTCSTHHIAYTQNLPVNWASRRHYQLIFKHCWINNCKAPL